MSISFLKCTIVNLVYLVRTTWVIGELHYHGRPPPTDLMILSPLIVFSPMMGHFNE